MLSSPEWSPKFGLLQQCHLYSRLQEPQRRRGNLHLLLAAGHQLPFLHQAQLPLEVAPGGFQLHPGGLKLRPGCRVGVNRSIRVLSRLQCRCALRVLRVQPDVVASIAPAWRHNPLLKVILMWHGVAAGSSPGLAASNPTLAASGCAPASFRATAEAAESCAACTACSPSVARQSSRVWGSPGGGKLYLWCQGWHQGPAPSALQLRHCSMA